MSKKYIEQPQLEVEKAKVTDALVQEMKDKGVIVHVEDLNKFIRERGVVVKPHIGGMRCAITVPKKFSGIDIDSASEDAKTFQSEHMDNDTVYFLPRSVKKELATLESSVRMAVKRAYLGVDTNFLDIDSYKAFYEEKFLVSKEKYMGLIATITEPEYWANIMADFKRRIQVYMSTVKSIDKDKLFDSVMSRVPKREAYKNSFYMNLEVSAFPTEENLDMFDAEIQTQIKEGLTDKTIKALYDVIGTSLNNAFDSVSYIIQAAKDKQEISVKAMNATKRTATEIAGKNIFANGMLETITGEMHKLFEGGRENVSTIMERAELILAKIYGYATELGVSNCILTTKCELKPDELLFLYSTIKDIPNEPAAEQTSLLGEDFSALKKAV